MNTQLYIPKKIRVGYQERNDTYTKKLAYVIYFDDKGVLRKEKSWQTWRDKKIDPEDFDNTPTEGFILHKDIKRYNWSHFSSRRTMIRVYDPRGIEFEITTDNLIGILMNTDCSKRALTGKFVYAWHGTELVLLPAQCEEYEQAANFTKLQASSFSAKDLVPGVSYKTKKEQDWIYVGRYHWYEWGYRATKRTVKKAHIFYDGNYFFPKSSVEILAQKNSEESVSDFARIIEKFQKCVHSSKIVDWEIRPATFTDDDIKCEYGYHFKLKDIRCLYKIEDGHLIDYSIDCEGKYTGEQNKYVFSGIRVYGYYRYNISTGERKDRRDSGNRYDTTLSLEEFNKFGLGYAYAKLENGKTIKVDNIYSI